MASVGDRIKARRIELGLSVDELAQRLGKNRATVYRYESNDIEHMPITTLVPLAEVLQTSPADLMGWETEENPELEDPQACPTRILAAHLEEGEYTEEELEQIREFADFLRSKRDRHD